MYTPLRRESQPVQVTSSVKCHCVDLSITRDAREFREQYSSGELVLIRISVTNARQSRVLHFNGQWIVGVSVSVIGYFLK
jgi:hypothetical protein